MMGDILDWFFTSNITIRNYLKSLLVDLWLLNEAYPAEIRIPLDAAGKAFVAGWQKKLQTSMSPLMRQISGMDLEPAYQNMQARLNAAAESGKGFLDGEMKSAMRKVVADVKYYDELIETRGTTWRGLIIAGLITGGVAYTVVGLRKEHKAQLARRRAPGGIGPAGIGGPVPTGPRPHRPPPKRARAAGPLGQVPTGPM
jgi:hypothetical protein